MQHDARAAAREDGAVLARPLHVVGRQGERRHGGEPAQPVAAPRPRQLPRARPRDRPRRGDARCSSTAQAAVADDPNENLARELMELFTIGRGPYTQADVRAAATALAGFTVDWESEAVGFDEESANTVVARRCSASRTRSTATGSSTCCATTRRARRSSPGSCFTYFVGSAAAPARARRGELAATFRDRDLEIRPLVEAIVTARRVRPPAASPGPRFPVEWHRRGDDRARRRDASPTTCGTSASSVSSRFYPPNVAGWPVGMQWVGAGRQLLRASMTLTAAGRTTTSRSTSAAVRPDERAEAALHHCGLFEFAPTTRPAMTDRSPARPGRPTAATACSLALALASPEMARRAPEGDPDAATHQPPRLPAPRRPRRRRRAWSALLGRRAGRRAALRRSRRRRSERAQAVTWLRPSRSRVLVVIEMTGGNDGLSMAPPLDVRIAARAAPDCGPSGRRCLPAPRRRLSCLHPALERLQRRPLDRLVDGVGTATADLSHFEMLRRWWTGDPDGTLQPATGFLGRLCDALDEGAPVTGLSVGGASSPALDLGTGRHLGAARRCGGCGGSTPNATSWKASFRDGLADMGAVDAADETTAIAEHATGSPTGLRVGDLVGAMPDSDDGDRRSAGIRRRRSGRTLALTAGVLAAGLGVRVVHVPFDADFDTHEGHRDRHDELIARPRRGRSTRSSPTSTPRGSRTGCSSPRRASSAAGRRRPRGAASTTARLGGVGVRRLPSLTRSTTRTTSSPRDLADSTHLARAGWARCCGPGQPFSDLW